MFGADAAGADIALALSIMGAVFFSILAIYSWIQDRRSRTLGRIERFARRTGAQNTGPQDTWFKDRIDKLLEKAAPTLTRPLMPKDEEELGAMQQRLSSAGFRGEHAITVYLASKALSACLFAVMVAFLGESLPIVGRYSLLFRAIIGGGVGLFLPDLIVGLIARKRQEKIFYGLPDALDLLVVCIESGLGLDAALKRVATEIDRACPVLAKEFELCVLQLQMGKPRSEVLRDLGRRNGVEELRALAATLIQADRFGTSVGQALRVHSDAMRTRRRQQAEERAQKTTVKLLIPLILFIFPGIFVVLVGPAAIMIMRNLMTQ